MKNKRGDAVTIALAIIYAGWGSAVLGAIMLQPKHIIRKANERCIAYGGAADVCKVQVDAMTQAQRKEFIRDTMAHPQPMNEPLGG